jgi:hypothetical protein
MILPIEVRHHFEAFSFQLSTKVACPRLNSGITFIFIRKFRHRCWLAREGMRNSWKHSVQAAMDESDLSRLERKIQQAEVAIFQRIDAFSSAYDGEEEALFEALRKIRELANQLTPIQS